MKPQNPKENKVDTKGAQIFTPDYSVIVVAAKMRTNSHEHVISH
jgi:hypothetical protein